MQHGVSIATSLLLDRLLLLKGRLIVDYYGVYLIAVEVADQIKEEYLALYVFGLLQTAFLQHLDYFLQDVAALLPQLLCVCLDVLLKTL